MSTSDSPEFDPFSQFRLRYASVLARIAWRNLVRLILSPGTLKARPLRFPNRTPDLWAGWLGHATVLLSLFGSRILTDPVLTPWVGPVRRLIKLPIRPEELPPLDVVIITHAHCDHLSRASLKRLPRSSTLVVPKGCADLVADLGFRLIELGWGEEVGVGELTIEAFRARHWGRRRPLDHERGYNAYLLTRRGRSVLLGGDSALCGAYEEACRGRRVALALLPIGCYKPDLFERAHLTPEQALRTFRLVGADYLLPVHWGTLIISLEPLAEPPRRLIAEARRLGLMDRVRLVWPGGDFTYPED